MIIISKLFYDVNMVGCINAKMCQNQAVIGNTITNEHIELYLRQFIMMLKINHQESEHKSDEIKMDRGRN